MIRNRLNLTDKPVVSMLAFYLCFHASMLLADKASSLEDILAQTGPYHQRVLWKGDASTTATVSWSTSSETKDNHLRIRKKTDQASTKLTTDRDGKYSGAHDLYYHHVRLTELSPSTLYEVQLTSDGESSDWFSFKTAPEKDLPFSIFFGGDSRSDSKMRQAMNQKMAKMMSDSLADDQQANDILCLCHGGDYIVSGAKLDQWTIWLSDHELTTAESGQMLPVIATRGNHDRGAIFNELFDFPEDDKNYYSTDIGPNVRMVTLNTETSTAGDQAKWLKQELEQSRPEYRYLLAQYHKPAWPAVKGPSGALNNWVPLFEQFNVDLVCEADGHNIKRTLPIRDGKHDPTGIVYIGEGGLGVPQRTPKTDRWYLQEPGMADSGHHVQVITFTSENLTCDVSMLDGTILDHYVQPVRAAE